MDRTTGRTVSLTEPEHTAVSVTTVTFNEIRFYGPRSKWTYLRDFQYRVDSIFDRSKVWWFNLYHGNVSLCHVPQFTYLSPSEGKKIPHQMTVLLFDSNISNQMGL